MDEETEVQRRARQDGTQLAFSAVLRELVRCQFPNDQIRAVRRGKIRGTFERARNAEGLDDHAQAALQAGIATVDSIFAPGKD